MNIKSSKKIVSIKAVAALIVLFAFLAMCTPIQGIHVPSNKPPVADAGANQTALVGETVSFNGSGSYDPDGTIVSYDWDFGDETNGTGVTTSHNYSTAGTYTVTLTVTDNKSATGTDIALVNVTVPNQAPVVSGIPDQTVNAGELFTTINLDKYVQDDSADSEIIWTASGAPNLTVVIVSRVANITYLAGWSGSETITFTATDPGDLSGSDDASFTVVQVNQPPDASGAYPSIDRLWSPDCIWPPNHKFVDITIEGVTDPDGDEVTITITNITSDEPTATIDGAGGDTHAPDADPECIGTAIASVRAERSGTGNGRVYEITFVASDGIGEPVEGTVQVKVPHDQSGDCESIDDGQNYDATAINV